MSISLLSMFVCVSAYLPSKWWNEIRLQQIPGERQSSFWKQLYFFKKVLFTSPLSCVCDCAALQDHSIPGWSSQTADCFFPTLLLKQNKIRKKYLPLRQHDTWLIDGDYYLWSTAVRVIDSALYLLLMVLGNVFPVEEHCCDFLHHPFAFNIEWNNKY